MENPAARRTLPAALTPRVLVRGHHNAGKTRAALAHVADLVAAGCDPASVMLVVASPTARDDARRALAAADPALGSVRVLTARAFELDLLGEPAARAVTGRRPRVLADFEEQFLIEDLRTTSMAGKRIKGMFGFFQRGWTELADDDLGSFILDAQEYVLHSAIKGHLSAYDALHPCEVSNFAVNYLRVCPEPAAASGLLHVVIDDYQALNRASQQVFELLAPQTLWVFADEVCAAQGSDPFPYLKGVTEFVEHHPEAVLVSLEAPAPTEVAGAASALVELGFVNAVSPCAVENRGKEIAEADYAVGSLGEPPAGVEALTFGTPREEFDGVAGRVEGLLGEGAVPSDVVVAVPNRNWASNMARALAARGVATQVLGRRQAVGGNLRQLEACGSARLYTALALLADPKDALAWRCWCGFGDYLGRSNVFGAIERQAAEHEMGVAALLDELYRTGEASTAAQQAFFEAYRQGRAMIQSLADLRGASLVAELASGLGLEEVPSVVAAAQGAAGDNAHATAIFDELQRRVLDAALAGDEGGVRIVEYGCLAGIAAEHLLVTGCMNGWFPEHAYFDLAEADFEQRRRMDTACRAGVYALAGAAGTSLVWSGFELCDLESAERLKLKGYRVRMDADGVRVTTVKRSDVVEQALTAWGL